MILRIIICVTAIAILGVVSYFIIEVNIPVKNFQEEIIKHIDSDNS